MISTWPGTAKYAESIVAGADEETIFEAFRGNAIRMLDLPEKLPTA